MRNGNEALLTVSHITATYCVEGRKGQSFIRGAEREEKKKTNPKSQDTSPSLLPTNALYCLFNHPSALRSPFDLINGKRRFLIPSLCCFNQSFSEGVRRE
jgi:hypothetical protein